MNVSEQEFLGPFLSSSSCCEGPCHHGKALLTEGTCDLIVSVFGYVMRVKWNQHDCQEAKVLQQNIALKEDSKSERQESAERDAKLGLRSLYFFSDIVNLSVV